MGEYATRKEDGQEIKIGTCESMYYLRYEDRNKVDPQRGSLNPAQEKGLFWRLPFPDEDAVQIGEYDPFERGYRLFKPIKNALGETISHEDFEIADAMNHPGMVQLTHPCGLLVNVSCYHGMGLPDLGPDAKAFWNGKSWFLELVFIKNYPDEIRFVIRCRHCGRMWSFPWEEVKDYIQDEELKKRLEAYIQ